jgi:type II restriction enzyme
LSKDLGAIAGLLFEIGSNQLIISGNADAALQDIEEKAAKAAAVRHTEIVADQQEESEHTQVQHALIKIGRALNYDVFVARNDRHRTCCGDDFSLLTTPRLPALGVAPDVLATVELIDVIWLTRGEPLRVVCAFEIEHSTSIFSGILRMKDLAHSLTGEASQFYLVAPMAREKEVAIQMARPCLYEAKNSFCLGYLRSEDVKEHCDGMCKFGGDYTVLAKIARAQSVTQKR